MGILWDMQERIVAPGVQNSYAQMRGEFSMPDLEPREPSLARAEITRPTLKTNPENPRKEGLAFTATGDFKTDAQSLCESLGIDTGIFKDTEPGSYSNNPKITFKDALDFARTYNAIRDEQEVVQSKGDIGAFKRVIKQSRIFNEEKVDQMERVDAVALGQVVFHYASVEDPGNEDFQYSLGSEGRKLEETVAREEINKAKDLGQNELLTTQKIAEFTSQDDFERNFESKTGGPGTTAAADEIDALDPDALVPEIQGYVRELQRINKVSPVDKIEKFKTIDSIITNAVLEGKLDPAHPDIEQVRDILQRRIDMETRRATETEPAEELLTMTTYTKELLKTITEKTPTDAEWLDAQAKLKILVKEAQDATATLTTKQIEALSNADTVVATPLGNMNVYRFVFEVTKAIDDYDKTINDPVKTHNLELAFQDGTASGKENMAFFIKAQRNKDKNLLRQVDRYYSKLYENYSLDEQHNMVGDINERANYYLNAILGGWRDLDAATRELMYMVGRKKDVDFGLREWRSTRYFQRLVDQVRVSQLSQKPADWADVSRNLSSMYSYIEDAGVGSEELGPIIQRAGSLIESMPADTPEGRENRLKLNEQLEAFKAWHLLIITADAKDMDPEALAHVFSEYFNGRDERTLENFINRFGQDNRGREFFAKIVKRDELGNVVKQHGKEVYIINDRGEEEEAVNLFDIQNEAYSNTLRAERVMMNMIEEMTSYGIENRFDRSTINKIKSRVGYDNLPDHIKDKWETQLEMLRVYFKGKMTGLIAKKYGGRLSVNDVWGMKGGSGDDPKEFIKDTFALVDEWRQKRTLHGAYKNVNGKEDADALAAEMRLELVDEDISGNFKELFHELTTADELMGKSYLEIRRRLLQLKLMNTLEKRGLKVNRDLEGHHKDLKDAEMEELEDVGFFGSVDYNAYQWAWLNQWSNYDNIHIYSRGSRDNYKLHDDYEMVTFHNSTSMFNARNIDHGWAFLSENIENRGRAKDVNKIWKQGLPGKHHYIFPQNTHMVRFAGWFMTDEQKKQVSARTDQMMRDWDFDNEKYHDDFKAWMERVVIMDMVENGEISFGQKKFSEIAKDKNLTKFAGIDLMSDRVKVKKFMGPDMFQDYLINPTEAKFLKLMDRLKGFYSTRVPRVFPANTLYFRSHWEFASKHREKLFDRLNLNSAGGEQMIQDMMQHGDMERKQGEKEKRKMFGFNEIRLKIPFTDKEKNYTLGEFFGTVPFRRVRQFAESLRRMGWESKHAIWQAPVSAVWEALKEFIKQLPKQSFGGR